MAIMAIWRIIISMAMAIMAQYPHVNNGIRNINKMKISAMAEISAIAGVIIIK